MNNNKTPICIFLIQEDLNKLEDMCILFSQNTTTIIKNAIRELYSQTDWAKVNKLIK